MCQVKVQKNHDFVLRLMVFNQQILLSELVVGQLQAFTDPSIVQSMFMFHSFLQLYGHGHFEWMRMCAVFQFTWTKGLTWRPLSVVCKLFTFQASSPKPLGRLKPNLAGMFLGWSSKKLLFFIPVGYSIWLPGPIICSDWLKFQRSSSLKLMN